MSPLRVGRVVTAWMGAPLGPGRAHSRGTEPDLRQGVEPTLVCAALLLPSGPGALQRVLLWEGQGQSLGPGQ